MHFQNDEKKSYLYALIVNQHLAVNAAGILPD